jgi:MPBQ/MSBQ methyltransferase
MLFPAEADYRRWFERAGFTEVSVVHVAPEWHAGPASSYGLAIAGVKPAPGASPLALGPAAAERVDEPMTARRRAAFAGRFVAGSAAGAAFVPVAAVLALRARLRGRA